MPWPAERQAWPADYSAAEAAWCFCPFSPIRDTWKAGRYTPPASASFSPACVISAVVYLLRGGVALSEAAPYLAGGLVGGWLGARLYGHIPLGVLRWLAAGVLLYGGVRYLL